MIVYFDHTILTRFIIISLACLLPTPTLSAISESQVKAVFLYNFASFVRWPETAFTTSTSTFRYCTVGMDAVVRILPEVLAGESINNHPLVHVPLHQNASLDRCHILYIASQDKKLHKMLIQRLWGKAILSVSSLEDFHHLGGGITLTHKRKRIHPIINMNAIRLSRLNVSAKLLRLATLVNQNK